VGAHQTLAKEMNRIAQTVFATALAALSVIGCKRSSEPPKYAIVDGEELVVPSYGRRDSGIKLTFPKGYRSETFKGCDFHVYSYHDPHKRGKIEFYSGYDRFHNSSANATNAELVSANFGRLKTTFRKTRANNGFYADAMVLSYFSRSMSDDEGAADGEPDLTSLQIMITANDEAYFQEAWAILNTAERIKNR
jgi:hypothetical protein